LSNAKYHDVAVAFGARGQQVTRIEDLRPAIKEAFASGEPCCINVAIDVAPLPPELHLLMSR
jgi:thiamine pyrophosphate-dependent acetolactate synthase large subunit-like protein